MNNNKGFSLVELIIVIAIMAILVGVMAPQLIKYIEKTNVSSDTQLCDTVKSAVTTAIMDPQVINSTGFSLDDYNGDISTMDLGGDFVDAVEENLGCSRGEVAGKLKSKDATSVTVIIAGSNSVHVTIPGSHADGKGGADPIYVD